MWAVSCYGGVADSDSLVEGMWDEGSDADGFLFRALDSGVVDGVPVLFHVVVSAEVLEADMALEWFLSGVSPLVSCEMLLSGEGHGADSKACAPELLLAVLRSWFGNVNMCHVALLV